MPLNMLSLGLFGFDFFFFFLMHGGGRRKMPDFGYSQFKAINFYLAKPPPGGGGGTGTEI